MIENNHDWKIHKILDETRRVYVCPARGTNKVQTQLELYVELMNQGKDITFVRKKDLPKKDPFKVYKEFLDKDLICNREPPWLQDAIDKYFEEEMKKYLKKDRENWKPIIRMDTTALDDGPYRGLLFQQYLCPDAFVIRKEEDV